MGKKKHAEHVNHERWLVSYADLLTLLFAFFVVLFASSVSDKKKATAMAAAMQSAFAQHGVFDAHAPTPPLEQGASNSQGMPAPLMMPLQVAPSQGGGASARAALERAIKASLGKGAGNISVHQGSDGIVISLQEAGFFSSGSAEVRPVMLPLLARIAKSLPDQDFRVEGHTDNVPVHSDRFRSNWELSTARAAAIADALLNHSTVAPQRISLAGYGEFRPVQSNATAEGRAANRRVDIVLTGSATQTVTGSSAVNAASTLAIAATGTDTGVAIKGAPTPLAQQLATNADRAAAR